MVTCTNSIDQHCLATTLRTWSWKYSLNKCAEERCSLNKPFNGQGNLWKALRALKFAIFDKLQSNSLCNFYQRTISSISIVKFTFIPMIYIFYSYILMLQRHLTYRTLYEFIFFFMFVLAAPDGLPAKRTDFTDGVFSLSSGDTR